MKKRRLEVCLTFDVEERFHSHLCPPEVRREWRLERRITAILDWLWERRKRATFFVVGEVALHYPDLVRRMAAQGEVASHSHRHIRMRPEEQEACLGDIALSRKVLEEITGERVTGFRAPSWSARLEDSWLWDRLLELGFEYDSSLFPLKTPAYGSWTNPRRPCRLPNGLPEIPPAVRSLGPLPIPYGGGFYFRLLPLSLTRLLLHGDRRLPVLYFHPWEFEPCQAPLERGRLNRFIGNYGVAGAWKRFASLVAPLETCTMAEYAASLFKECSGRNGGPGAA